MQFIRGLHNLKAQNKKFIITVGNFDGVHLGHQKILRNLQNYKSLNRKSEVHSLVMIFEPQPKEVLYSKNCMLRLTSLKEKLVHFKKLGVDNVICVNFNKMFAQYTAKAFIHDILKHRLNIHAIIAGHDFKFGASRMGNINSLKHYGKYYGFKVLVEKSHYVDGMRVSSSVIREKLHKYRFGDVEKLLGYPFMLSGTVIDGRKIGQQLDFPTGNLIMKRTISFLSGVYLVEILGVTKHPLIGVANIGIRPTIAGGKNQYLEFYIINLKVNLYGLRVSVILREKIRNEVRFDSLTGLKNQIQQDVLVAKKFFYQNIPSIKAFKNE